MKILVIEDEEKILKFLEHVLTHEGHEVTLCESADDALENDYIVNHDLVILDLMLEGIQGDEFVQKIRKSKSNIPILVLSALGQISTKIDLLKMGVDDYMTKPFDAGELIARLEALYRRYLEIDVKDEEDYGEIKFYRKQNKVVRHGKEILLTNREGDLLAHLLKNEGKTVRTEDILAKVWHAKMGYHSNIVQATIRRLRKKIDEGFKFPLIRNVHGIGYSVVLPQN